MTFLPPQPHWWWWAAWSTRTAGTLRRWRGCVAREQISTAWGTAPCAGPTSWPSSASWTPSSSLSCPSPSATGRINCCQMNSRWREEVKANANRWADRTSRNKTRALKLEQLNGIQPTFILLCYTFARYCCGNLKGVPWKKKKSFTHQHVKHLRIIRKLTNNVY